LKKRAWLSVLLLLPTIASAQFDMGGPPAVPAWEQFKLNPKTTIKLDFKNASIDSIISFFQKQAGITIVKDPTLTGPITVTSAKAVPLKEAFQILSATLNLKGYEFAKEGKLMLLRKKNQNPGGGFDPSRIMSMMGQNGGSPFGEQPVPKLKVYPIKYANASQVARVVNEVFLGVQQNQNPFANMFGGGGGATMIMGGRGGQPGRFGNFNPAMFQRPGQQAPTVRASSDDFSNSVIINAPDKEQKEVEALIRQIDKETDEPQISRVIKLEFANATDLAPVVQNVLVSNAPRGRGGVTNQNTDPMQRFQQAMRLGSAQAAFGQVVADTRTNSLVVTATPQNIELVEQVVKQLDTEVEFENTTFVFPLSNAKASDVAQIITQAFGQRQVAGQNFRGGQFGNQMGGQNRNNQNRNNQNRAGGARGLGGEVIDPDKEVGLETTDEGELQTNVAVAQGFQFMGGGGGQNRAAQQPARDQSGRIINVRELQGQISAIPDPNTNSIIVVATPENAEVIRNILDQLDKIPEQVMIETIIVEATLDSSDKLGVEWNLVQNNVFKPGNTGTAGTDFGLGTAAGTDRQGFKYTLSGGDLSGFIQALKTDQKFQVLSTPRIFTSNNVQAEINISQSVPYILSSRQDANGAFTYNYTFQDVGIILTVTPRITTNGYVTMEVTQTANELQGFTSFNAPIVNQRQADTTVSVKDGETIILGGIIRNTVNSTVKKLPLLGDLPILGNLFKSTSKQNVKTELLVFLSPRVVRDPGEARKLREDGEKGMSPETKKALEGVLKNRGGNGATGAQEPPKANTGGDKKTGG
jgi:general secretion pathway protein D